MSQPSTEHRFLHSTMASYASLAVRLVVSFGARMLLARLILPDGHGLYELALRVVTITAAIRDLGLTHQLVRDEKRHYGTVLVFTLGTGVLLTVGLVGLSPLFTYFDPELPLMLRVLAIWVLFDGLAMVPKAFFERQLRIGRLVVPEILRGLVLAVVSVGFAMHGWQEWSLVFGELAAALLFAILAWRRAWQEMPRSFVPAILPGMLKKSVWLFAVWVVLQLVAYIDVYIIEIFEDTATVGIYARAYWIVMLVPMIVAPRALLPALVEYRDDAQRFFGAFRLGTIFLLSFQVLAAYFLFFNAHKVVAIILGPEWEAAVPLLQVLCFLPLLDVFTDTGGEVLKVRHEDRTWLGLSVLNLLSLVGFGTFFASRWGALGMACANFLLLGHWVMAWRMSRIFSAHFGRLLPDLLLVYLGPLPFFALAARLFPADSWTRFAASWGAAALGGGILAWRFYRPFRDFFSEYKRSGSS